MTLINLQKEYKNTQIKRILNNLNKDLIGLKPIKSRIQEIAALLLIDKVKTKLGIKTVNPGLHMSFTGNPGTGKTLIGFKMADILYQLEYINKGHLLSVTRDDLVGQYIGHTAPKTKAILKKAKGGVLFIDEAYYLYKPNNERDYGSEAIEILLQVMENQRNDLVIIFAGYKKPMNKFYESNPGLFSRITNHINFPNYSIVELLQISKQILNEEQYQLTNESEISLTNLLEKEKEKNNFANARTIKNLLDKARLKQASRIFDNPTKVLTKYDLITLESMDIN